MLRHAFTTIFSKKFGTAKECFELLMNCNYQTSIFDLLFSAWFFSCHPAISDLDFESHAKWLDSSVLSPNALDHLIINCLILRTFWGVIHKIGWWSLPYSFNCRRTFTTKCLPKSCSIHPIQSSRLCNCSIQRFGCSAYYKFLLN